jgi:hypothetical protein
VTTTDLAHLTPIERLALRPRRDAVEAFEASLDANAAATSLATEIVSRLQTLSLADAVEARDAALDLVVVLESAIRAGEDYHHATGLVATCDGCGERFFPASHRVASPELGLELDAELCPECIASPEFEPAANSPADLGYTR